MTTTVTTQSGREVEVALYFTKEFKGRGGWNIICEATIGKGNGYVNGFTKKLSFYTTDSEFIDSLSDDLNYDEKQDTYKDHSFYALEEQVQEWAEECLEEIEENEQ